MTLATFLIGCFTDVKGRPEPKNVLGFLFLVSALVYAFVFPNNHDGFLSLAGTGTALLSVTTVADGRIDASCVSPPKEE